MRNNPALASAAARRSVTHDSSPTRIVSCVLLASLLITVASAGDLQWRVSIKVILDADGERPTGGLNTDVELLDAHTRANELLDTFRWPYSFEVTEIVELAGHSEWFDLPADGDTRDALEAAAEANPAGYLLRANALNVYVLNGDGGGFCQRPFDAPHIYVLGRNAGVNTPFHESGHVFGLCHSHGCVSRGVECIGSPCGGADSPPTSDDVADTIPDKDCWLQDEIACFNYGDVFADLTPAQQERVNDVWMNLMSYHSSGPDRRLTPDQLDILSVTSNQAYAHVGTGLAQYVGGAPITTPNGLSMTPHASIPAALVAAELAPGDDVLILRPGTYGQPLTISQSVCLRASRGNVIIGQ